MSVQIYKGDILLSEPEVATTQWEKARGLMFRKQHDVLFHFSHEKKLKFHMVFVFYPIDIVFLDSDLKVVDLKPRFKPFTFYYSKARSSTVLETYAGFIRDRSIRIGDTFSIVHSGEIDRPSDPAPVPPAHRKAAGTSVSSSETGVEASSASSLKKSAPQAARPAKSASKKAKGSKTAKTKVVKKSAKTTNTSKKPVSRNAKRSAKPRSTVKPAKRAAASSKTKKPAARSAKTTKPKSAKSVKPKRAPKKSATKPAKKPVRSSAKSAPKPVKKSARSKTTKSSKK